MKTVLIAVVATTLFWVVVLDRGVSDLYARVDKLETRQ